MRSNAVAQGIPTSHKARVVNDLPIENSGVARCHRLDTHRAIVIKADGFKAIAHTLHEQVAGNGGKALQ